MGTKKEGVIIRVGIDGVSVTQSLKSLKNAVKASTSQMKAEMTVFDRAGDSIGKLDAKYRGLQRTIEAQDLELQKLQETYRSAAANGNENSAAALKYANQINNLTRKQTAYRKQLDLTSAEIEKQKSAWYNTSVSVDQSVSKMNDRIDLLSSRYQVMTAGVEKFGSTNDQLSRKSAHLTTVLQMESEKVASLSTKYEALAKAKGIDDAATIAAERDMNKSIVAMKRTESELKKVSREMSLTGRASRSLNKISSNAQKASDKLSSLGTRASLGITLPVAGGLGFSVKDYMEFNNELLKMRALLNDGSVSVSTLNNEIKIMGKDTQKWSQQFGQSTSSINQAEETLIKRGYDFKQTIGAMPSMLNAARASGDDFNSVINVGSSVLEEFNMRSKTTAGMTKNTQKVMDTLSFVANKTATNFQDIGTAMEYVGPVAHSVGYSLASTAAAEGELSNNGIEAEKAGTQLRMALTRMLKPSKQNAAAFEKMGISTKKLKKGFYTLPELIKTINEHTKNMTKAEKAHLIAQGFGARSQTGMNILLSQGADKLRKLSKETQDATGYTKKLSDQMGHSAQLKVKKLGASFHVMEQEIGKQLVPELIPLIKQVTHLIKEFGDLSDAQKQNIVHIGLLAAGLGPATLLLNGMLKPVILLTKGFKGAFGAMSKLGGEAKVLGTATKVEAAGGMAAASGEAEGLVGALGALGGPVGLAVAGVTALGIGAFAYYEHQKKANEVSLKAVEASQKQYEQNKSLIDSFTKLKNKSLLTNQQFGDYLDLQTKIKQTTDPSKIKDYRKQMDQLQRKSGLSNGQFKKMIDLNKGIVKNIPKATTKITEQGNAIVTSTNHLKDYNKAFLNKAINQALIEREKTLKNQPKIMKEISKWQKNVNEDIKVAEGAHKKILEYNQQEVDKKIAYNEQLLHSGTLDAQRKQEVEGTIKQLKNQKQLNHDMYLQDLQRLQKDKATLANYKKQGEKLDQVNQKIAELILEQAGVNRKVAEENSGHGKSLRYIQEQINKLQEKKSKMIQTTPVAKRNTQEFRDGITAINGQISSLRNARREIEDNTGQTVTMNKALGKGTDKKIQVYYNSGSGYTTNAGMLREAGYLNDRLGASINKHVKIEYTQVGSYVSNSAPHLARGAGHNANGTNNWRGGLTWVGERGAELIDAPRGAKIYTHNRSVQIARELGLKAYASGTNNASGGLSLVGEHGKELMNLGLTSNSKVIRMMQQMLSQPSRSSQPTTQTGPDMTKTNELLLGVIAAINKFAGSDFNLSIDGRNFAKATFKEMMNQINIENEKVRRAQGA